MKEKTKNFKETKSCNEKLYKNSKERGITLIALIVTIIVLLILAGITISTLVGENGIITKANEAKIETRGASVKEARDLWMTERNMDSQLGESTAKSLEELINDLVNQDLLTEDEKDTILGNEDKGIEAQYQITIGSHFIDFSTQNQGTEIDYENLAPGLYETGTANMIKSWEQLIEEGEINIENNFIYPMLQAKGDLIISEGIIGVSIIVGCGSSDTITGMIIPSTIEFIMYRGTNLEKIYIKEGYTGENNEYIEIESYGLQSVHLPSTTIKIGDEAFANCTNLKSIELPDNIVQIGENAFSGCTSLETVKLPDGQIKIGKDAFSECNSLKEAKCKIYQAVLNMISIESGNELLKSALLSTVTQSYYIYAQNILDNLPTNEIERNASIDKLYIDAFNYYESKYSPNAPVLETLQDVWDVMGNGYTYSSVQEYYQAQESSNYASCEEMLIDQFMVDPEGFDENN